MSDSYFGPSAEIDLNVCAFNSCFASELIELSFSILQFEVHENKPLLNQALGLPEGHHSDEDDDGHGHSHGGAAHESGSEHDSAAEEDDDDDF